MAKRGRPTAIYMLSDLNGEVRYVGKSTNPTKRLADHMRAANGTPVANWCAKLRRAGQKPHMDVLAWVDDWESAERHWIAEYRERGARLLNIAEGGLDMAHVHEHRGRYRAYAWVVRFCARTKNVALRKTIRATAEAARRAGDMAVYDRHLAVVIRDVLPFRAL